MYRHVKIMVVDDSKLKVLNEGENKLNIQCIYLPFWTGVSVGRNAGVNAISTKYTVLLDDDMVFTEKTNLKALYLFLSNHPDTALISMKLDDRDHYRGLFSKIGDKIEVKNGILYKKYGVTYSHRTLNCFMATTDLLRKVPWDPRLKTVEHTEHFYRIYLNGYKVCDTDNVELSHNHGCINSDDSYYAFRNVSHFIPYILDKYKVSSFIDMELSPKQKLFSKTLIDALDACKSVKPIVSCGTALGIYREEQFIEHDEDIDLFVFRSNLSSEDELPNKMIGFTVYKKYGSLNNGLEYTFIHNITNVHLDIFVLYEEPHFYWIGIYNASPGYKGLVKWKYPKMKMNKMVRWDRKFYIVPKEYLNVEYGDMWMISKKLSYTDIVSYYGFVVNDDNINPLNIDDGPVPVVNDTFMKDFFGSNIYFINMDKDTDRLENVIKSLDGIGITDPTRFPGIVVKSTSPNLRPGEVGCALSHMGIWKKAVNNKVPWTLIFEDDIYISPTINQRHFAEGVTEALSGRKSPDIIYFGGCCDRLESVPQVNLNFDVKVDSADKLSCTHAYAITWRAAKVLLDNYKFKEPIDVYMDIIPAITRFIVSMKDDDDEHFGVGLVKQNRDEFDSNLRINNSSNRKC